MGGGVFGLQTALKLVEKGKKVAIVESGQVGSGVSNNTTAKVSALHSIIYSKIEKKFNRSVSSQYAQMNMAGVREMGNTIKKYGIECDWTKSDSYTIALSDSELRIVQDEIDAANHAGLYGVDYIYPDHLKEIPFPNKGAIRLKDQYVFNSFAYCQGLAKALEKSGVFIYENSRVHGVEYASPHIISTNEGNVMADKVVIATHLPILDRSGHFSVIEAQSSYCVAFKMKEGVKAPIGNYITIGKCDEFGIKSIRSAENGKILIIAGNSNKCGEFHPTGNSQDIYDNLIEFGFNNFQVEKAICGWSALDYFTADTIPYFGLLHHGINTVYTATGCRKWGFSNLSAASLIVSDMICETLNPDTTGLWSQTFDARRWDLAKSTLSMVKFQSNVAKHFVATRIRDVIKARTIDELGIEDGGICKQGLETIAAYRDGKGEYHLFHPTCTHLGCHLDYNNAEKTFDCSCHGSRFKATDGEVIHGPAVKPLTPLPLNKL